MDEGGGGLLFIGESIRPSALAMSTDPNDRRYNY